MMTLSFDPVGRWFEARSHHGVDDRMTFGVVGAAGQVLARRTLSHARFDGIGALHVLLPEWGVGFIAPQDSREQQAPGWREILQARPWVRERTPIRPGWRRGPAVSGAPVQETETLVLGTDETAALKREAKRRGVSLLSLVLWAEHRMVMQHLCADGDGGTWFVPVNLRGPLALPSHNMNHSAGVYLDLPAHVSPERIHASLRQALKRKQHWWNFYQALWAARLGQTFLNWLYPRVARPGHCLGSFSMLGDWHVDWRDSGLPEDAALYCCGPGSPAYPVSNGVMVTNGRLTLTLKFDAFLGQEPGTTRTLLGAWRNNLTDLLPAVTVPGEEAIPCRQG